ncbi:MAG: DUF3616 domain-containing protein [Prochlorotrichaceae cyanobacterium]
MVLHPLPSVRLDCDSSSQVLTGRLDLSGLAFTPDGRLWLISDETRSVGCLECIQVPPPKSRSKALRPRQPYQYAPVETVDLGTYFPSLGTDHEIDLEGICYTEPYLWLMGSHSTKRKQPRGEDPKADLKRLKTIVVEPNRYFLARIPWQNGTLHTCIEDPQNPSETLTAAWLSPKKKGSVLLKALEGDEHFGAFIAANIPSKENGLDLEGLAIVDDRIFLGLRGPVLRGYAAILEIAVEPKKSKGNELKLKGTYRKHFLNLEGLGIRDLQVWQDQLLILAGPTLALDGSIRLFQCPLTQFSTEQDTCLTTVPSCLGDIPHQPGSDRAEGITLWPHSTAETAAEDTVDLLVVYDAPHPSRLIEDRSIWADRFHSKVDQSNETSLLEPAGQQHTADEPEAEETGDEK